ncbi:MAG: VanZ family protein, partial [Gammaproteobacteria bacterium]|nr:VanZ family protein [Gammaproteobacteria bacterium]
MTRRSGPCPRPKTRRTEDRGHGPLLRASSACCYRSPTAAIFALSSIPDTTAPETGLERALHWASPELQNLLHIPLFGGLAWCWHWGLQPWLRSKSWRLCAALAVTLAYSVLDEVHQLGVPGRFGSLTDVALNAIGAVLALAVVAARRHGR